MAVKSRVADPYSFDMDLDQHFKLNSDPDPDPGVLMTKNRQKNLQMKKIKF
jgi:hypothetical protein